MTTREGRRVQARTGAHPRSRATAGDHAGDGPEGQMAGLSRRFPPRPAQDGDWPATSQRRGHVLARLFAPPFTAAGDQLQSSRRIGLTKLVHWLEEQPGRTWQDRWVASGADAAGNLAWRELAASWLRGTGWASANPRTDFIALGRGVLPLICGDVIRPSLPWLLTPGNPEEPRRRDGPVPRPRRLRRARRAGPDRPGQRGHQGPGGAPDRRDPGRQGRRDRRHHRRRLPGTAGRPRRRPAATPARTSTSCCTRWAIFPPAAPPTVRAFKTPGQLTVEQLVDRYPVACRPVRALIIDYLRERQPAVDHATLRSLSRTLAGLFWRDLELHHPGIGSLRLDPGVAAAWKQRVTVKTVRAAGPGGQVTEIGWCRGTTA